MKRGRVVAPSAELAWFPSGTVHPTPNSLLPTCFRNEIHQASRLHPTQIQAPLSSSSRCLAVGFPPRCGWFSVSFMLLTGSAVGHPLILLMWHCTLQPYPHSSRLPPQLRSLLFTSVVVSLIKVCAMAPDPSLSKEALFFHPLFST